jgi:hypothetical protein
MAGYSHSYSTQRFSPPAIMCASMDSARWLGASGTARSTCVRAWCSRASAAGATGARGGAGGGGELSVRARGHVHTPQQRATHHLTCTSILVAPRRCITSPRSGLRRLRLAASLAAALLTPPRLPLPAPRAPPRALAA